MSTKGDVELAKVEEQLAKYLDRMYEIVQVKHPKTDGLTPKEVFAELQKVIDAQLQLEISDETNKQLNDFVKLSYEEQDKCTLTMLTGVPLVDIIINIDWFTAHFEDRNKVLRIVKDLFNNCSAMKQLLAKHGDLIMTVLMSKYDKQCHLFLNKAGAARKGAASAGGGSESHVRQLSTDAVSAAQPAQDPNSRDEFLAVIIGQMIRLYAKSKSLSRVFQDFELLERMASLCKHE